MFHSLVKNEGEKGKCTGILHEGMLANACKPPDTPNNFAAVPVPTIADKLGARMFMRELT